MALNRASREESRGNRLCSVVDWRNRPVLLWSATSAHWAQGISRGLLQKKNSRGSHSVAQVALVMIEEQRMWKSTNWRKRLWFVCHPLCSLPIELLPGAGAHCPQIARGLLNLNPQYLTCKTVSRHLWKELPSVGKSTWTRFTFSREHSVRPVRGAPAPRAPAPGEVTQGLSLAQLCGVFLWFCAGPAPHLCSCEQINKQKKKQLLVEVVGFSQPFQGGELLPRHRPPASPRSPLARCTRDRCTLVRGWVGAPQSLSPSTFPWPVWWTPTPGASYRETEERRAKGGVCGRERRLGCCTRPEYLTWGHLGSGLKSRSLQVLVGWGSARGRRAE